MAGKGRARDVEQVRGGLGADDLAGALRQLGGWQVERVAGVVDERGGRVGGGPAGALEQRLGAGGGVRCAGIGDVGTGDLR